MNNKTNSIKKIYTISDRLSPDKVINPTKDAISNNKIYNYKNSPNLINLNSQTIKRIKTEKKIKKFSSVLIPKSKRKAFNYSEKHKNNLSKKHKYINKSSNNFKYGGISIINKIIRYKNFIKNLKSNNKDDINLKPTLTNNDIIYNDSKNSYVYIIKEKSNSKNKKMIQKIHSHSNNNKNKVSKNKNLGNKQLILNKKISNKKNKTCNNFYKRKGRNSECKITNQISGFSSNSKRNRSSSNKTVNNNKKSNNISKFKEQIFYCSYIRNNLNSNSNFSNIIKIRKKFNETCKYFYYNNPKQINNILKNDEDLRKNINNKYNLNNIFNKTTNEYSINNKYLNKNSQNYELLNKENNEIKPTHKNIENSKKLSKADKSKSSVEFNEIYDKLFNINENINKYKNNNSNYFYSRNLYHNTYNIYYNENKKLKKFNNKKKHYTKQKEENLLKKLNIHSNFNKNNKDETLHNNNLSLTFIKKNKSFSSRNKEKMKCFDNPLCSRYQKISFNYFNDLNKTLSLFNTKKNFNSNNTENTLMQSNIKNNLLNLRLQNKMNSTSKPKSNNPINNKIYGFNKIKDIKCYSIVDEEKNSDISSNYYLALNNLNKNIEKKNNNFDLGYNLFHTNYKINYKKYNNYTYTKNKENIRNNKINDFSFKNDATYSISTSNSKIDKRKEDLMKIVNFSNNLCNNQKTN